MINKLIYLFLGSGKDRFCFSPEVSVLIAIQHPFPGNAVYELHAARQINSSEKCTFLFGNNAISLLELQQSYFASTVFKSKMKNYIEDVCAWHCAERYVGQHAATPQIRDREQVFYVLTSKYQS